MFALFSFLAGLVVFVTSIMLTIALRKVSLLSFSRVGVSTKNLFVHLCIGIRRQNSTVAMVVCSVYDSPIFSLAIFHYS